MGSGSEVGRVVCDIFTRRCIHITSGRPSIAPDSRHNVISVPFTVKLDVRAARSRSSVTRERLNRRQTTSCVHCSLQPLAHTSRDHFSCLSVVETLDVAILYIRSGESCAFLLVCLKSSVAWVRR